MNNPEKLAIQGTQDKEKENKNKNKNKNTTQHNMCWTPLYVNKRGNVTMTTTGGKDEPNIVFMRVVLLVA